MCPFYRRRPLAPVERRTVWMAVAKEAMRVELEALDDVGLVVSDMSRSIRWYQEVLGLRRAHQEAWGEFPADNPMRHVGFRTSRRGPETAKQELAARGIEFEEGDYGVAWSVYLPDPDGCQVEITTYEPAPA
jgi:catechol 2,3-dioxygenase-like lactoylglutathione lyase family enzyme